jgi:hypothetical protein
MSCVIRCVDGSATVRMQRGQEESDMFHVPHLKPSSLMKLDRGVVDAWRNLSYARPDVRHVSVSSYVSRG